MTYVVEPRDPITLPDRGPLGHFLPFDRGVLDVPRLGAPTAAPSAQNADGEWEVLVKRGGELSSIYYAFDPADVRRPTSDVRRPTSKAGPAASRRTGCAWRTSARSPPSGSMYRR
ncbi:hypothetical protein [Streptomyces sp. ISL-94]|uniref:hypothetical protein n=1 Tax=Streptomyces sp. ISL-94 TaxID=2819190 RepID=UPI001BE575DD|nr:hypothetical protein [Streptomyces sp. ISL-94]MBT2476849.1 hypothetical protein [Streptomyces sp. ISL-94]